MTEIFREVDEDYRHEQLLRLWHRNAGRIIAVLISAIVIAALCGLWKARSEHQAEAETFALAQALDAARDKTPADALPILQKAIGETTSHRRIAAQLAAARQAADAGDANAAVMLYNAVADSHAANKAEANLARISAITLQIDSGDPAMLNEQLKPLADDRNPWRFSARELQALLALRQGDMDTARSLLSGLSQDPATPEGVKARATSLMKLYPSADAAPPASSAAGK